MQQSYNFKSFICYHISDLNGCRFRDYNGINYLRQKLNPKIFHLPMILERFVARLSLIPGKFGRMISVSVTADNELRPDEIVLKII